MPTLSEIKKPIRKELVAFESFFKATMKSNVPLLNLLIKYILKRKGKQMRPILVFLTARLFGEPNRSTHTAAALIEILHTATLIHDDVVDDSNERRGFFSVNAIWKSKISVLLGDYLLAKGLLLALNNQEYDLLQIVSDAVKEMSEGELLQIKHSRKLKLSESEYFEIIRKKTATLLSSCSACGAQSVGMDHSTVSKMKRFGELLGIAFQIKDDLIDFQNNNLAGKPSWNDLKDKKLTLPLIHALEQTGISEKRRILRLLHGNNNSNNTFVEIVDFVNREGGVLYAKTKMQEYSALALKELDEFDKGEIKDTLTEFVYFTTTRKL